MRIVSSHLVTVWRGGPFCVIPTLHKRSAGLIGIGNQPTSPPTTRAMAPGTTTLLFFTLIFVVLRRLRSWIRYRKANPLGLPYPPGPKPLPLLGNLLDVPSSYYWLTYAVWAKKYGDINHISVFGQHIVILNSIEACTDLLEKRSAKYSDRPRFPMMNELYVSQYNVF